jgi:preprotein translocase subunit SecD
MLSLILSSHLLWSWGSSEYRTNKYEQKDIIINSDLTLQTGFYYIVEADDGFKRQLDKDSLSYFIDPTPIVTSKNIVKFEIYTSNYGGIGLSMKLDDNGTIAWSEATEKATGKELAFIVDNKLIQVARVISQITGGMTALNRGIYTKRELEEIQKLIEN